MAAKKDKAPSCFSGAGMGCCQVEAMVSVDEKGQMVLPKTIRKRPVFKRGTSLFSSVGKRTGRCAASPWSGPIPLPEW